MHKNCNNCKALERSFVSNGYACRLGHEIEITNYYGFVPINYRPLEECEKPTGMKALVECEIKKYEYIKK